MAFGYIKGTISGSQLGDGTTRYMQQVSSFMQNNLGWTLVEDRSAVVGATKQIVLKSNGEDNTASTFYFVITSGTNSAGIQAATAWDTSTHAVAASGAITPSTNATTVLSTITTGNFIYWVSGDKDSLVLLTRCNGQYDMSYFGKIKQITSPAQDPFPIYVTGDTSQVISSAINTSSTAYSFLNGTTAYATSGNTDFESLFTTPLGGDETPQNIFGSVEGYVCLPCIAGVSTSTQRSVRGFSINLWTTIGPNASTSLSLTQEDIFDPGNGRTYQVFFDSPGSSSAAVIRRT